MTEKQKWENIFLEDCAEYDKKIKEEQKAEEYQIKKHHKRLFGSKPVVMQELKKTFIDGYHECQKEHEWHYVKDGLPKL